LPTNENFAGPTLWTRAIAASAGQQKANGSRAFAVCSALDQYQPTVPKLPLAKDVKDCAFKESRSMRLPRAIWPGASSPNSDCCLRFLPECGRPKKETRMSWNTNGRRRLSGAEKAMMSGWWMGAQIFEADIWDRAHLELSGPATTVPIGSQRHRRRRPPG
jgi:hypothetical protein